MSLNASRHVSRTNRGMSLLHRARWKEELRRELLEIEFLILYFGSAYAMLEHWSDLIVYH